MYSLYDGADECDTIQIDCTIVWKQSFGLLQYITFHIVNSHTVYVGDAGIMYMYALCTLHYQLVLNSNVFCVHVVLPVTLHVHVVWQSPSHCSQLG